MRTDTHQHTHTQTVPLNEVTWWKQHLQNCLRTNGNKTTLVGKKKTTKLCVISKHHCARAALKKISSTIYRHYITHQHSYIQYVFCGCESAAAARTQCPPVDAADGTRSVGAERGVRGEYQWNSIITQHSLPFLISWRTANECSDLVWSAVCSPQSHYLPIQEHFSLFFKLCFCILNISRGNIKGKDSDTQHSVRTSFTPLSWSAAQATSSRLNRDRDCGLWLWISWLDLSLVGPNRLAATG